VIRELWNTFEETVWWMRQDHVDKWPSSGLFGGDGDDEGE
jgi:hypothetical protein